MRKIVSILFVLVSLATVTYKLLTARGSSVASDVNIDIALSNKRKALSEENIAKCKEKVQPLEVQTQLLKERIQRLQTKNNESKLELAKCGEEQSNCNKGLAKCEYTVSQAQDGKCKSYEAAEAKSHEDYGIINKIVNLSDNCEQSIGQYKENINELEALLKELKESKDQETMLECKNNLEKCKTSLNKCDLDLIDAGCSH